MRPAVVALTALAFGLPAAAHGFRPARVEIVEVAGVVRVRTVSTPSADGRAITPVLPSRCVVTTPWRESVVEGELVAAASFRCAAPGLSGERITLQAMAPGADALLRWAPPRGAAVTLAVRADAPSATLPLRPEGTFAAVAGYVPLGFEHILTGWDHLAFVFLLLLLVRRRAPADASRRLLSTVTAFTLGHSVTLALAAVGALRLRAAPVEAVIALSIALLAGETSRPEDAAPTLSERRPWSIALGFGLLHGLGFAGALAEVGLPEGEVPGALAGFNVGVELGQLAFVTTSLAGVAMIRRLAPSALPWTLGATRYAAGALGMFWTFDRLGRIA
jgi:hypothetical protein